MKLHLENLPASLVPQRETLRECLEAMDRALPIREVILFGSHARGEARADSDVDLCIVADDAAEQFKAAARFRKSMWAFRRAQRLPSSRSLPSGWERSGRVETTSSTPF